MEPFCWEGATSSRPMVHSLHFCIGCFHGQGDSPGELWMLPNTGLSCYILCSHWATCSSRANAAEEAFCCRLYLAVLCNRGTVIFCTQGTALSGNVVLSAGNPSMSSRRHNGAKS